MPLSNLEIATRVRNLVSEKSPAAVNITIPHIVALIPTAMETWARAIMDDEERSEALVVETTVAVTSGAVDLTNYFNGTSAKISQKDLRGRTLHLKDPSGPIPVTWVGSYNQLKYSRSPQDFPAVYLDGNTLRFRGTDGSLTSVTGINVGILAVNIPSSATDIPAELVGDFITYLADLVVREKIVDGR